VSVNIFSSSLSSLGISCLTPFIIARLFNLLFHFPMVRSQTLPRGTTTPTQLSPSAKRAETCFFSPSQRRSWWAPWMIWSSPKIM
jgi:hypothetical protein